MPGEDVPNPFDGHIKVGQPCKHGGTIFCEKCKVGDMTGEAKDEDWKLKSEVLAWMAKCEALSAELSRLRQEVEEAKKELVGVFNTAMERYADYEKQLSSRQAENGRMRNLGKAVMDALKEHGPSIVPHLLDTDDNAGQRFREALSRPSAGDEAKPEVWQGVDISSLCDKDKAFFKKYVGSLKIPNYDPSAGDGK